MTRVMPWERNDTRDKMVASAALLMREYGVAGTSFARVLQDSGAPRGSIGHHFPGGKAEMVADAVRLAGDLAAEAMRRAVERGESPAEVWVMVCGFYRRALVETGFAAGCPIAAVAQEAHEDPELRKVAADAFNTWRRLLVGALIADGRSPTEAVDLTELCVAGMEGAIMLARVARNPAPLDRVERQLIRLLA